MSVPPPHYPTPRRRPDVPAIVLLSLAWVVALGGGFLGLLLLAFFDSCPPATCSRNGAVGSVAGGVGGAFAVALLTTLVVVVRSRQVVPRRAWPWALGGLLLVLVLDVAGVAGFFAASG